jgi:hypothetical protein
MSEIELQDYTHRKIIVDAMQSTGDNLKTVHRDDAQAHVQLESPPPSRKQVNKARIRFITLCWTLFLAGWNDASTGPLLPRIQEVYHVTFFVEDRTNETLTNVCDHVGGICRGLTDFRGSMYSEFIVV